MTAKQPAMSPSDLPVSAALDRATGPANHTIYLPGNYEERWPDLLARLGKYRASKVCLYLTRLTGVDRDALREILERSLADTLEN